MQCALDAVSTGYLDCLKQLEAAKQRLLEYESIVPVKHHFLLQCELDDGGQVTLELNRRFPVDDRCALYKSEHGIYLPPLQADRTVPCRLSLHHSRQWRSSDGDPLAGGLAYWATDHTYIDMCPHVYHSNGLLDNENAANGFKDNWIYFRSSDDHWRVNFNYSPAIQRMCFVSVTEDTRRFPTTISLTPPLSTAKQALIPTLLSSDCPAIPTKTKLN